MQPRINRASEKGKMGKPVRFSRAGELRSTSDALILIIDCKKLHGVIGEDARVFDTPLRCFDYVFCDHFPHSARIAGSSKPAARRFNPVPCFVESGCEHVNKLGIENRRGLNEFQDFYHRIPPGLRALGDKSSGGTTHDGRRRRGSVSIPPGYRADALSEES